MEAKTLQEQIDIKAMAFRYANTIENHCQAYGQPSGDFLHNILVEAFEAIQNSQQSATLDEIQAEIDRRIRIIESEPEGIVKQTMIDGLTKNLPRLHSQQPTVEVDALWNKYSEDVMGYGSHIDEDKFKQAIQEALRGTYTKKDMIRFGDMAVENYIDGVQALDDLLDTFTAQRNKGGNDE